MHRPEFTTISEVDALNGQRQGHCHGCGMTFPIAGDRAFDGTRYWQPLNITVLLAERDAARADLAQHAALVTAAREYAEALQHYQHIVVSCPSDEEHDEALTRRRDAHFALSEASVAFAVQPAASVARGEGEGDA